ncbi:helix-turn-helix domain-containing protein [Desulfovibrio sp. OttesenSCG-928-M16]|nr:helix-turn-helix domain-containing protein [Desulfovibrio sp. OttesenSCG-928-M16]
MGKISDLLQLLENGYRLYTGTVPQNIYLKKFCPHPKRAEWLAKTLNRQYTHCCYVCLGCDRMCSEMNPTGWQLLLPLATLQPAQTAFVAAWPTSAEEMLVNKMVLRVDEASWVLNVSTRTVYRMLQEGKLRIVEGLPVRVTTESIRSCLTPVDYLENNKNPGKQSLEIKNS